MRCYEANFDDRTGLVSQVWAPKGTKLAYLAAGAGDKLSKHARIHSIRNICNLR